ncbi:MAG: acetoacetate--CoA ligase, partial [Saccharospirillum sp.]
DRFGQVEPKVVIAGNGYGYGGKAVERTSVVKSLQTALPTVRQWIQVDALPSADVIDGAWQWADLVGRDWPEAPALELPFDHPLYILYSSGTTGKPKCIVHGAGGTLLQHAKELRLHGDISQESVFFYFTTTGWMMWNWLASGLMTGATLVLFDGNPMYPRSDVLWQLADKLGITHFGTSAKYLSACRKQSLEPGKTHNLSPLTTVFSTGSPLAPEDYDWVYSALKPDVMLQSISGGTDIVSCFVGGNPWSPVVRGKIQGANLGMDVQAWNEAGERVINQRGELVCAQPAPCMPIGFWNDPDDARYRAAYFERFDGVWAHGDFIEFDDADQAVIHGRSDTTLNPGGVRIGTAEIYRQVETLTEIADSLVVGQAVDGDVKVILFVQLPEGQQLDKALTGRIRQRIRENTTPRHVPADIVQVPAIPYTRSGKKVELAVTQILRGEEPANLTALANPESLEAY